jgi:hypothetical protein
MPRARRQQAPKQAPKAPPALVRICGVPLYAGEPTRLRNGLLLPRMPTGRCEEPCFPGMVLCYDHVSKDALALLARMLIAKLPPEERAKYEG